MSGAALVLLFSSLLTVFSTWILPLRAGLNFSAGFALVSLVLLSPVSALWLVVTTLTTVCLVRWYRFRKLRGAVALLYSLLLVSLLLASREATGVFWVGGAYFTLRHLHVVGDWWMGRIRIPTIGEYFRYSLFLPVLMAGPIHRLDNFQRQVSRQRLSASNFFVGAERTLIGLTQVVVISSWALRRLQMLGENYMHGFSPFLKDWVDGGFEWLQLYFSFAGLTSVAVGLSLMMGLRIEENFDRPWAARNLIDFWSRWHMTLSHWCRDYVFYSVTASTRMPALGLLLAMLAMGLWHDTSLYYVLWAVWQSLGILLTHLVLRFYSEPRPGHFWRWVGPLSVIFWLTLTRPVVQLVLELLDT